MNKTTLPPKNLTSSVPRWAMVTVALLLVAVLAGGGWFYRAEAEHRRRQINEEIQTIAKLKVKQLVAWRAERQGDAAVIMRNPYFTGAIAEWMKQPDARETENLLLLFRSLADNYRYSNILLVDAGGRTRLDLNGVSRALDEPEKQGLATALRERRAVLIDLHLAPGNASPMLDVVAPCFHQEEGTDQPVGAVILEVDAAQFLYPVVQSWPTPSLTAENTLFRREGAEVLVLAEMRHAKDAAMKLRIPLSRVEVPAVMAALGRRGLAEGVDYRGVKVLAVLDAIPDSPWLLITKIDAAEATEAWRQESRFILLLLLLVAVVLAAVGYVWQLHSSARERQRSAAALELAHARLRWFVDANIIGIVIADATGRIIEANDYYLRLIGSSRKEFVESKIDWRAVTPAEWLPADEQAIRDLRRPGTSAPYEKEYLRRDGSRVSVILALTLLPGPQEQIAAFVLDQTESKRAGELLRRSEEKFAKAFLASPTILMLNRISDGRIVEANDAFEKITGYTREEALGRTTIELNLWVNLADRDRLLPVLRANRRLQGEEVQFRAKDGELIIGLLFAELLELDGEACILAVVENITVRKQLEQQFLQAQKMDAIGHLAGGVAHDFNNILAALMMGLELLSGKDNLDQETRISLKELEGETKRAASLTRQLLMFSRRSVLEIRVLDLNEVAANLLKMLGRLLGAHITFAFERQSNLPTVEADAGMLEQVLMNLVVNARDAMPRGGRITITTEAREFGPEQTTAKSDRRAGRFVCLAVADTGVGMNTATLKRIFEPFFTTKEAGKGTGLGLATVYGIVKQHGGWVEVESEVNHGTTFRVYLPATTKVVAQLEEAKPPAIPRGQETLLVVEDDASVRQMLVRTLRVLGYRVFPASTGQEAMNLWRDHGRQIDLMLTDMVMPEGMTGLELAERVRAEKPDIKIIISSGYSTELVPGGKATVQGIVYLPKPYEIAQLGTIIRRSLNAERNPP